MLLFVILAWVWGSFVSLLYFQVCQDAISARLDFSAGSLDSRLVSLRTCPRSGRRQPVPSLGALRVHFVKLNPSTMQTAAHSLYTRIFVIVIL